MTPATATSRNKKNQSEDEMKEIDKIIEETSTPSVVNHHSVTFVEMPDDPYFVVSPQTRAFLRAVARIAKDGEPVNVGLRGPKGAGKTSLAVWYARQVGAPLFIVDVPTLREPKDLLGYKDIVKDGEGNLTTRWITSGFVRAIQTPGAVVLLDEATRVHPSVLNILLPLMDHRRSVYLDDLGETIHVAPGVTFFLTANIGMQYTGTWQWDAALEDRMSFQSDIGYLSKEDEAAMLVNKTGLDATLAKRFAEVAAIIRQRVQDLNKPLPHEVSPRQLIATAKLVGKGVAPIDAFEFTIVPTYSTEGGTESDRANVLQILQGKLDAPAAATASKKTK